MRASRHNDAEPRTIKGKRRMRGPWTQSSLERRGRTVYLVRRSMGTHPQTDLISGDPWPPSPLSSGKAKVGAPRQVMCNLVNQEAQRS